ncbi:DUF2637 domain-containing protein [Streptomyces sp. MP131-18]|uniref:DUF2637 domain-containing protein n=1 Tax=Streptomyces sp. MP131-18 TaxID=1857892 RepID=UPI0009D5EC95|nr:DUF2637 domain-containing protein [Streptomyces sp. MP131-18]ONK13373.1 hypothetical protein STBA_41400 [Streptomyces sp. MP131-18]
MAAIKLTRSHRILVGVVLAGAVVIAAIGFAGSYAAVRDLAERKDFGAFAPFFPIGIDAGIVVLLSLDLLLTWLRIPFPLLRQSAWLLTAATIAFNAASAWGDPLAVCMHGIIPVLFVITVEAARHAIGRVADITADKHMEGVRIWRWFLSPVPTFRLWRRMKLWELRSYEEVISMERDRLVYQAQLRASYGRAWRRRAPVEARMPLKLARYGVPLRETAPAGLAAAGAPAALPGPAPQALPAEEPARPGGVPAEPRQDTAVPAWFTTPHLTQPAANGTAPHAWPTTQATQPAPEPEPEPAAAPHLAQPAANGTAPHAWPTTQATQPAPEPEPEPAAVPDAAQVTVPVSPGRRRNLGSTPGYPVGQRTAEEPQLRLEAEPAPEPAPEPPPRARPEEPAANGSGAAPGDAFYTAYREYILEQGAHPNARQLSRFLHQRHGTTDADGSLLSEAYLREFTRGFRERYNAEMGTGG